MAESESKKQRRPNFSTYEIEVLVSEIGKKRRTGNWNFWIYHQSPADQRIEWERVANAVNADVYNQRTGKEIRDKWRDLKTRVKSKASKINNEIRKTGGRSLECTLNTIEQKILSVIGRVEVEGLEEGMDIGICSPIVKQVESSPTISQSESISFTPTNEDTIQSSSAIRSFDLEWPLNAPLSDISNTNVFSINNLPRNRRRREGYLRNVVKKEPVRNREEKITNKI